MVGAGAGLSVLSRSAKAAYLSLMAEKLLRLEEDTLEVGGAEAEVVAERGTRLLPLVKGCRGAVKDYLLNNVKCPSREKLIR